MCIKGRKVLSLVVRVISEICNCTDDSALAPLYTFAGTLLFMTLGGVMCLSGLRARPYRQGTRSYHRGEAEEPHNRCRIYRATCSPRWCLQHVLPYESA